MGTLDIAVITLWMLLTLGAGVWFSRRASASTDDFFVSGRSLPWWVVGTSMVATTSSIYSFLLIKMAAPNTHIQQR